VARRRRLTAAVVLREKQIDEKNPVDRFLRILKNALASTLIG
jgi:hypothetical protein